MPTRLVATTALFACALVACQTPPGTQLARKGDEIVVCGQLFHTGTPVVLWNDPGGYDAYRTEPRFRERKKDEPEKARYGTRRNLPTAVAARVANQGWSLSDLQEVVHLFVLHYDVAGVSRRCFKILQDERNLSVHFMLDVDGTIYQTLDLKERAWHATIANDHSVGIEIAHPGAYPQPGHLGLQRWYEKDDRGLYMKYPAFLGEPGVRTAGFIPRPAQASMRSGTINGRKVYQYDFTEAQYRALAKLTATLAKVFPRIQLRYPKTPDQEVVPGKIATETLHSHDGIVGHFHVQKNKADPGPAFDWKRLVRDARKAAR